VTKNQYKGSFADYFMDEIEEPKKSSVLKYVFIAVAAILIIALIYFAYPFVIQQASAVLSGSENCETSECFITAANSCKSATFEKEEAGSIFSYSASNCILTKTVKQLNEIEPQEIKDLLEGKSMTCAYTENTFNANWINTFSVDIESCSGDLKDALDILIATL